MDALIRDMRYAARSLARSPVFTTVAVLTLALGIGANATIFSLVNAVLLRPPAQVRAPDRLVWIYTSDYSGPPYSASSYPDYEAFAGETSTLSGAAAFAPRPVNLVEGGRTTRLLSELVSVNYFDVLGVRPTLGRGFQPADGSGARPVAIISQGLWRDRFAADPEVVGHAVHLNGGTFTIVGVAPPAYRGAIRGLRVDVWVPFQAETLLAGRQDFIGQRGHRGLLVIGRLRPGVSVAQAQARFKVVAAQLYREYPDHWRDVHEHGRRITVVPERMARVPMQVRGSVMGFMGLLAAVVGLVLLICCANVANLLLARGSGRAREISVRLALGAGRRRLVRQLLTESLMLAGLGGGAGLVLAVWGAQLLSAFQPPVGLPLQIDLSPDRSVLVFTLAATVLTALAFGLAPALRATRRDVVGALKGLRAATGSQRSVWLQSSLVVVQVASSLVLLVGAGLFLRSLSAAQSVDVGFDPDGVVVAGVDLSTQGYDDARMIQFYGQLRDRLSRLPGVSGVALAASVPLSGSSTRSGTGVAGYTPAPGEDMEFHYNLVGPDYFKVMHIPLLRGRAFTSQDRAGAPNVAIVNEAFAQRFWPGEDPIGKRLTYFHRLQDLEVVGVVPTGKYTSLGEAPTPFIYAPFLQDPRSMDIHVRTTGDAARLIPLVRREIHAVDPNLPIPTLASMPGLMAVSLLPQRMGASVLSLFAGLAMLLAAVGLYGVIAYGVSRRTREIGIRMALGADRGSVTRMVVRRGMALTAMGMAVGLVLAGALSRLAMRFLFGVGPLDPVAFGGVVALLLSAALLASWLPAHRAARVDPMSALRYE